MKETVIKEQVRTIENATRNAAQSKEKALQFLKNAGIILPSSPNASQKKK